MFKKTIASAILTLVAVLSVNFSYAAIDETAQEEKPFNKAKQHPHHKKRGGFFKGLGLTEDQKKEFKESRMSFMKEMKPLMDQKREKKAKLISLSTSNNADLDSIKTLIAEIGQIEAQKKKKMFAHYQKMKATLSTEQQKKFAQFDDRKGNRGHKAFHKSRKGKKGNKRNPEKHFNKMAEKMRLNDSQKNTFKASHQELKKKNLNIRNQVREKREKLHTIQTQDNVDLDTANSLIDEIAEYRIEMRQNKAEAHQKLRSILTEDQRILFDTEYSKKMNRKRHHFRK